jgi:hypothetical protein
MRERERERESTRLGREIRVRGKRSQKKPERELERKEEVGEVNKREKEIDERESMSHPRNKLNGLGC